jgi:uncharacterized FlaG/YvyC family protein
MEAIKKLFESEFSKLLMKKTITIVNNWSSIHATSMEEDTEYFLTNSTFESVGTIEEQKCFKKSEKFIAIQNTLEDLNKVFIFLKIERNKILEIYPEIHSQESYFKYHIENYIIRIYTIVDLVGKLGNLLYETNIPDDDCNCYKFKEKIKKENSEIGELLEDILKFIDEIKKRRHSKIHTGEVEIKELTRVSFWEDFSEFLPAGFDFDNPILKSMNETNFNNMVKELQEFLNSLVIKINIFLDKSVSKI